MKTDPLEKFVRDNREAFDELEPDPGLWYDIESKLQAPKIHLWKSYFIKAAAFAAIFIAGYFFSFILNRDKVEPQQTLIVQSAEIQALLEAKAYYTSQIDKKKATVFKLASDNQTIKEEISKEFSEMEEAYNQLQHDLADEVASEVVIEAMIQHYRLKLELLEDILQQIQAAAAEKETDKEKEVHYVF
jgi:hypothetical protein